VTFYISALEIFLLTYLLTYFRFRVVWVGFTFFVCENGAISTSCTLI